MSSTVSIGKYLGFKHLLAWYQALLWPGLFTGSKRVIRVVHFVQFVSWMKNFTLIRYREQYKWETVFWKICWLVWTWDTKFKDIPKAVFGSSTIGKSLRKWKCQKFGEPNYFSSFVFSFCFPLQIKDPNTTLLF